MGNKRVSQLLALTAPEVSSDDLLLIIDTSVGESKNITTSQLSAYLNASGSLYAIHAINADSASYVLGSNVYGPVANAVLATNAGTATTATSANTAISSSYSNTSSWAINVVNGGSSLITGATYPITSSWAVNSTTANLATTAANLIYIPGVSTSTASYALSSSISDKSITSSFASFAKFSNTASFSLVSLTTQSIANSASFLIFSPNNGTSSYAIRAGTAGGLSNYGMFLALEQSSSFAMLDNVAILSSLATPQSTTIQAIGTAILAYTSSIPNTNFLNLTYTNRVTGVTGSFDTTQVSYNVTPIMNQWNSLSSGSFHIPFDLVGQSSLYGDYLVEVVTSDSRSLQLDSSRIVRFLISSYSDIVNVSTGSLVDLYIVPTSSLGGGSNITFSSIAGGPFYDTLPGLLTTGSSNIITINIASSSISEVDYTWKCSNLTDFSCSSNPSLTRFGYSFPNSLKNLYCSTCSINSILDLSNTQLVNLDCRNNQLLSLPTLPSTLITLDCSNNPLFSLPNTLPSSLQRLYCNNANVSLIDISSSVGLLTASFVGGNLVVIQSLPDNLRKLNVESSSNLVSILTTFNPYASLPKSMSYLSAFSCSLSTLPSMSINMSYLNISNNPMQQSAMERATSELSSSNQTSGSIIATGIGSPNLATYTNLYILSHSLDWTIQHDGFP